jgi:hypothetical protein
MNIFDLHQSVLPDHRDFVRSFSLIADDRARPFVDQALKEEQHLWPETLVQLNPVYASGPRIDQLAREGLMLQETGRIFSYPPLPPFRYDPERRAQLRAELDALFFLLYLGTPEEWEREATPELKALFPTPRHAVEYILDQFPIVRRKDEERFGEYRTKRLVVEAWEKMAKKE